ncbi:hypothetical protein [Sphingomonas sp. C3-2]|uniref:hypothetical protein n=1 Tax=Sphingomonas sp. C3-2 TaxID=3062169 RepID=UPI00294AA9DF|nr:hypothetical protein [Sphingomonas sp. C3-2]WOK37540.1 hypothetical protein QYC26_04960 [Sphingomonas sp. C3-2]
MAAIDGSWECMTKTPVGEQTSIIHFQSNGDSFTGTSEGQMGTMELLEGKIVGDTVSWKMQLTQPMKMTLEATATVSGDTLSGGVKAGMFGTSPLTGTRRS